MNKITRIAALAALAAPMLAFAAPVTDVQDFTSNTPTEYFVPSDSQTFNAPYYRGNGQGWGWTHNAIGGSGFSSIKLSISAFDVDFASGERDRIEAFDGSSWVNLGNLAGGDSVYAFSDFDLTGYGWAEAQVNAGLQVRMTIDTTNAGWFVTLAKSTLDIDGGSQSCVPTPGAPCTPTGVPEPSGLALMGAALGGLALTRRRARRA